MAAIKFGTDGWRSRMDVDFNESNVAIVAQAIADYLTSINASKIVIGYDTRRNSRRFAEVVAEVMSGNSIHPLLSVRDCPTPAAAFTIKRLGLDGAVVITASHNPPEYNGIKFIPHYAGPANKKITDDVVRRIAEVKKVNRDRKDIEEIDISGEYLKHVEKMVNVDLEGKTIVADLMYGTARGYLDKLLENKGANVIRLHGDPDPNFGGHQPDPLEEYLKDLAHAVKKYNAYIGVACDGDADRLGGIDSKGRYISPNVAFASIYLWMLKEDDKGDAGRTVSTTHLIDKIANEHGYKVYETPVGYKYLAELFLQGKIVIGGEESGGISIRRHIPEKDGILSNLLLLRAFSTYRLSHEAVDALYSKYGMLYYSKIQIRGGPDDVEKLKARKSEITQIAGLKVTDTITIDGLKFLLENNAWGLIRASGTEPLIRIQAEGPNQEICDKIVSELAQQLA